MNLPNSEKKTLKTKLAPMIIGALCTAGGIAGINSDTASASSVFPMQEFNVIVLGTPVTGGNPASVGTFNDSNDMQGSAFINGDVSGSTFAGNGLPVNDSIGLEATGGITLSSVHVNNGSVLIGGTAVSGFTVNSGKALSQGSSQPATDLANFSSALTNASDQWAGLAKTSGATVSGNDFTIPTGAGNFVVFNITASTLVQNNSIVFTGLGTNQQVLINVSGTSFSEPGGVNFNGDSTQADNVIWNFSQATSISLSSGFYGSILAPDATLSTTSTITGDVAVADISSTGEIDFASPNFTPPLNAIPTGGNPAPIPASFGLVGLGSLAMLAGVALRKRIKP
jgi:choice-of-anchor A domain-containing protein